ncbi:hypothetical protein [Sphingomonas corticis]|uniref:Uncharacterized protein n=1 Tax=Sphingomonas corticis TaxID=2722791 RepID=A0ABX1CRX5_9SPHN|nr:hypothetical protein [Sphingomonas corticis]NJR79398.1 hypothetical protein [Sphingomonas corticis]
MADTVEMSVRRTVEDRADTQPDGTVPVVVERDPALDIATVDMSIIGFLGRDFTVSCFAAVPRFTAMYMSNAGNVIGPERVDHQTAYRETISLRIAPAAASQLAVGLVQAIKDAAPDAYADLHRHLMTILENSSQETLN